MNGVKKKQQRQRRNYRLKCLRVSEGKMCTQDWRDDKPSRKYHNCTFENVVNGRIINEKVVNYSINARPSPPPQVIIASSSPTVNPPRKTSFLSKINEVQMSVRKSVAKFFADAMVVFDL
jgi:hypothetical protein